MIPPNEKKKLSSYSINHHKKHFINLSRVKNELNEELEYILGKEEYEKFKQFAFQKRTFQQRIVDLIIGFTLGSACKSLAEGISKWIIMPLVSFCVNKAGTDWKSYEWEPVEGLIFKIGEVINLTFEFFIMAVILYIVFCKFLQPVFSSEDSESNEDSTNEDVALCSQCLSVVNPEAVRCAHCTSWLTSVDNGQKDEQYRKEN